MYIGNVGFNDQQQHLTRNGGHTQGMDSTSVDHCLQTPLQSTVTVVFL